MPFRIVNYSGTTSSPAKRDFAALNLLICGNTAKGEQASTIAQLRKKLRKTNVIFFNLHVNNLAENFSLKTKQFPSKFKIPTPRSTI